MTDHEAAPAVLSEELAAAANRSDDIPASDDDPDLEMRLGDGRRPDRSLRRTEPEIQSQFVCPL